MLALGVIRDMVRVLPLLRAGWVLAREGVLFAILLAPGVLTDPEAPRVRLVKFLLRFLARPRARSLRPRIALSRAVQRLGPSWIKLGQFLATRGDVVGETLAGELAYLQDSLPPFSTAQALAAIERAIGRSPDAIFTDFPDAFRAASIAQVHRAILRDSRNSPKDVVSRRGVQREVAAKKGPIVVAVKVLRPGVRRQFERDLSRYRAMARLLEKFVPATRRLRPAAVVDALAHAVHMELDLRLEAAAISEFKSLLDGAHDVGTPNVEWSLTAADVLTTNWIEGTPLSDVESLRDRRLPLPAIGDAILQHFLHHALNHGVFHADMHPGNIIIDDRGCLNLVDFGIVGRLEMRERQFLAETLSGFIRRDYDRVAAVHFGAGFVPRGHRIAEFSQALRAIGEPIHDHVAGDISIARLLALLFQVTALFDMPTRPELLLLQKTMVTVEGVARSLNPELNMWRVSEPIVAAWITAHVGVAAEIRNAGADIASLASALREAPGLVRKLSESIATFHALAERRANERFPSADLSENPSGTPFRDRGKGGTPLAWIALVLALFALLAG